MSLEKSKLNRQLPNVDIDITPKGSQVVLVTLLVMAIFVFGASFYFFLIDKDVHGAVFLIFCGVLVFLSCAGWHRSYKSTDRKNYYPTVLRDASGNELLTDSGVFENTKIKKYEEAFAILGNRKPLPSPSGKTDRSGMPIANTEKEAEEYVNKINQEVIAQTQEMLNNSCSPLYEVEQTKFQIPDEVYNQIVISNATESNNRLEAD